MEMQAHHSFHDGPIAISRDCPFCNDSLLQYDRDKPDQSRLIQLRALLFHGECSDQYPDPLEESLCEFCRHLRLRHLLHCLGVGKLRLDYIRFCAFEEIEKRRACPFCNLLIRTGMPYSFLSGMDPSARYEGGYLEMRLQSDSLFMRFRYRDGAWMGARSVYYASTSANKMKCPGAFPNPYCKGYFELLAEDLIKEKDVFNGPVYEDESPPTTFYTLNRLGGRVDWNLLDRWLTHCSSQHADCTRTATFSSSKPTKFRLIDVQRRRIISATPDCRYVALSYVWGPNPDMTKMTSRTTLKALQRHGGLVISDTPKTINDAITICRQLKKNYLWVDQYCIIQDDSEDTAEQISSMAEIYTNAEFVIIVTDGDMKDGVPGVSIERSQKQLQLQISEINFINEVPSWREITGGACIWSTRGWTYQEVILGRRKLYFTSSQSFFECCEDVISEEGSKQEALYSPNALRPQIWEPNLDCYYGHVRKYSERSLGHASDIYNAIDGVASALYKQRGPLWFGLPRKDFDMALLWCADSAYSAGEDRPELQGVPEDFIPSWSWASTRESVLLLDDCNRRSIQFCGPLVTWVSREVVGSSYRLETIVPGSAVDFRCPHSNGGSGSDSGKVNDNEENSGKEYACVEPYLDEKLLYIAVAWSQGCMEGKCPFKQPEKTRFARLASSVASRWPCRYKHWQEAFQAQRNGGTGLSFLESLAQDVNSLGTQELEALRLKRSQIVTRAQSAFFRLNPPATDHPFLLRDYPIIDDQDQTVGVLVGQDPKIQAELVDDVKAREKLEFIALSMSHFDGVVLPDASTQYRAFRRGDVVDESIRDLTYFDKDGTPLLPLPVVNVMLIRWSGSTARRVSVGWIYLTKWIRAAPQFKMIWLE